MASDSASACEGAQKQGISAAELARRADVKPQDIKHWENQGWVIRNSDRTINADATMAMVNANHSPTNGGKPDRGAGAVKPLLTTPATPPQPQDTVRAIEVPEPSRDTVPPAAAGINAIKAFRERVKAEKELLELRQKLTELVPVAVAERMFGAALASLVQNLENIPARVAPIFASMTDDFEIRAYLQDEIDKALHTITIPDLTNAPQIEDPDADAEDNTPEESKKPAAKETTKRDRHTRME